jgi:hypothetical protein
MLYRHQMTGKRVYTSTYPRAQMPQAKPYQMAFPPPVSSPTLPVALQSSITSNREFKEI